MNSEQELNEIFALLSNQDQTVSQVVQIAALESTQKTEPDWESNPLKDLSFEMVKDLPKHLKTVMDYAEGRKGLWPFLPMISLPHLILALQGATCAMGAKRIASGILRHQLMGQLNRFSSV